MPPLHGESADGVAVVTMVRPEKKNALSVALREAIADALDALAADDGIRAVVLTGDGEVFSAGFDLNEFQNPDPDFQRVLLRGCEWAATGQVTMH